MNDVQQQQQQPPAQPPPPPPPPQPAATTGQQKRPRVAEENRKRAVRACDGCRRVKEKCEGGVPCRRCQRYRRQCLFNTVSDHGEKARSASVSLLERAATLSRHDIAESERVRYMERILAHYVPNLSFDIQSLRKAAEELTSKHRDSQSEEPSTQADIDELEDLAIDDEDFTIKALPDNTTQYSGEFSYLNFSMKIRKKIDEWMMTAAPEDAGETEAFEERWRATQLQSGSSMVSAAITCLPPRYVADFLVLIFFKYAQTNNFYVEEDWLREKLNICYTDPSCLSPDDASSVCAILMVLAVGTQFAHMESTTPVNRLSSSAAVAEDHRFSEDEVGLTFYQFATKLLPDIIATASVRSVQACLLIGTYLLPLDTSGLSYTYFGLALKIAIQNGMHRRYYGEGLTPRMVEVRNRVFWTAYTIEKRMSILHGRPASLTDRDVDAALPTDLPELMQQGQLSNHANMVSLITLTLKFGEVVQEISLLRRSSKGQQHDCLERLLTLRKHLVEWWATLPEETNCRDLNPAGPHFRSNVHLKLDYCLTRIFIGRPFLFINTRGLTQSAAHGSASHKTPSALPKHRSVLVTDCVEAALEIIDLCRLLRDERGLARASFTEFSSCRAALLVILAQSLTKRTERLRAALEQGMGLIKIMSMGVGSARSAVNVIEALERAIRRLESWSETESHPNAAGMMESGYDRFKNWEMLWKSGPLSPDALATAFPEQYPSSARPAGGILSTVHIVPGIGGPATDSAANATGGDGGGGAFSGGLDMHTRDMGDVHTNIINNDNNINSMTNTKMETTPDFVNAPPAFGSPTSTNPLSQIPTFGFDHFVSNFPQELGEFTAIPCFDPDGQQGLVGDMKSQSQGSVMSDASARWMQFMSD